MTWLDGSRWDADKGAALTKLLIRSYPGEADARAALISLDIDLRLLPIASNVGLLWIDLTRSLHEARQLRAVVNQLAAEKPALAAVLADLAADPPGRADGNPPDMYQVQLLFGRRPLIDRTELRETVRQFLDETYPLLLIRGQQRAGKTYSLELLQHVTEGQPNLLLVGLDFAPVANGNSAVDLITKLCHLVDVEEVGDNYDPTTKRRKAIALVDQFVGRYNNAISDQKRRLLVIDGLNRSDLQDDVHEAVAHLAVEVIKRRLPRTQLVLTGYDGAVDPDLHYGCLTEIVTAITETHVRTFFTQLDLPEKLTDEKVRELVSTAMSGSREVPALSGRVRDLTMHLLEGR